MDQKIKMDRKLFDVHSHHDIITIVKNIVREEIGGLKDEIAIIKNECVQQSEESKKMRKEMRPTKLSPKSTYSNDITRPASDNYFTSADTMSLKYDMDKSGSQADESHCVQIDDDDDDDDDDDFASKVKLFFESSTLHGFHNLIGTSIWVRVLWSLAMTGAFLALSVQVIGITKDYLDFGVVTDISIQSDNKIFPALTVCNNRRISTGKVFGLPAFKRLTKELAFDYSSITKRHYLLSLYYSLLPTDFEDLGDYMPLTIAVSSKDAEIKPIPYHGSCYSVKALPNTTELTIAYNLHVNYSVNFKDIEKEAGFTVYFSDHMLSEDKALDDSVYMISVPAGHTIVSTVSHDVYNRLNGSYSQCQDAEHLFLERTGLDYRQRLCVSECLFRAIMSQCGFVPVFFDGRYSPFLVKANITGNRSLCVNGRDTVCQIGVERNERICDCKPKCHERIYSEVIKVIDEYDKQCFDKLFIEKCKLLENLALSINPLITYVSELSKNDTAFLTIVLDNSPYTTYNQKPQYPLLRFLSDIGGTMGLYLGASVLTTFEFVQMAISGISHVLTKMKQKLFAK